MDEIKISAPQQSNACTLISIAVIDTILNDNITKDAIIKAQDWGESQYKTLLKENIEKYKEGIGERETQTRFFEDTFAGEAKESHLTRGKTRDELIKQLLDNRKDWPPEDPNSFFLFNDELITALTLLLKQPDEAPDWFTANELELKQKLQDVDEEQQSVYQQFVAKLSVLPNDTGITLCGGGHTVSLTKKENRFYFYNSASGVLKSTTDIAEMAAALNVQFQSCLDVTTYSFEKKPELHKVHQGSLRINPQLQPLRNDYDVREEPVTQAQRVFNGLQERLKQDPTTRIALLFSANNEQAQELHDFYRDETQPKPLPAIRGGGQAAFYGQLTTLINEKIKEDPSFAGRIRILPFATSLRGGDNVRGNTVSLAMIDRDLDAVQWHLQHGFDVDGIGNEEGEFAIGANVSQHWKRISCVGVKESDQLISQGQYVQNELTKLMADIHYTRPNIYKEWSSIQVFQHLSIADNEKSILADMYTTLADTSAEEFDAKVSQLRMSQEYTTLNKPSFFSFFKPAAIRAFNDMASKLKQQLTSDYRPS